MVDGTARLLQDKRRQLLAALHGAVVRNHDVQAALGNARRLAKLRFDLSLQAKDSALCARLAWRMAAAAKRLQGTLQPSSGHARPGRLLR